MVGTFGNFRKKSVGSYINIIDDYTTFRDCLPALLEELEKANIVRFAGVYSHLVENEEFVRTLTGAISHQRVEMEGKEPLRIEAVINDIEGNHDFFKQLNESTCVKLMHNPLLNPEKGSILFKDAVFYWKIGGPYGDSIDSFTKSYNDMRIAVAQKEFGEWVNGSRLIKS